MFTGFQSRPRILLRKVMDASVVFSDDEGELCRKDDMTLDLFIGSLFLILRSIKFSIIPGFTIFSESTPFSPVSNLMTVDIEGRSVIASCVHRSPIFRNLHASSISKSSVKELSMIFTSLPHLYSAHVCMTKNPFVMPGDCTFVNHVSRFRITTKKT